MSFFSSWFPASVSVAQGQVAQDSILVKTKAVKPTWIYWPLPEPRSEPPYPSANCNRHIVSFIGVQECDEPFQVGVMQALERRRPIDD